MRKAILIKPNARNCSWGINLETSQIIFVDNPVRLLLVQRESGFEDLLRSTFQPLLGSFDLVVAQSERDFQECFDWKNVDPIYDLIILDQDYMGTEVLALIRRFRSDKRYSHVQILILSEDQNSDLVEAAIELDAILVLQKEKLIEFAPSILRALTHRMWRRWNGTTS